MVAALVAWSSPAAAETITVDLNGSSPNTTGLEVAPISTFDWLPGNTLLDEAAGTITYQANLNYGPTNYCTLLSGLGCWTAVATFNVTPTGTGTFAILPGGEFQIWANDLPGNDLAGTGFTAGTMILDSAATGASGTASLVIDSPSNIVALDQFTPDGNNYPNTNTYTGSGGFANIETLVSSYDPAYFLNTDMVNALLIFTFSNGSNNLPFSKVDPANMFYTGQSGVPSVGSINGNGFFIMAEADAATTIEVVPGSTVPEPATLTLFGIGSLLTGAAARRRQKKNGNKE